MLVVYQEVIDGLADANTGLVNSYGDDKETEKLYENIESLFENKVNIFPVISGTAANSIAFASCVPPYGAIFCSEESHINIDECNAPEFYTGGAKLINVKSYNAKLSIEDLINRIENMSPRGIHNAKPALISITQSSELGTVYSLDEISTIAKIAHSNDMFLHMDGARIANAVVHLNVHGQIFHGNLELIFYHMVLRRMELFVLKQLFILIILSQKMLSILEKEEVI